MVPGPLNPRLQRTMYQVLFPKQQFQKVPQLVNSVLRAQVVMGKPRDPRPILNGTIVIGVHTNQVAVTKVVIRVFHKSIPNRKKNFLLVNKQKMHHEEMISHHLKEEGMLVLAILSNLHLEANRILI